MRLIYFIVCTLLCVACEESITFDDTEHRQNIVMNSVISTDSTWNVNLSYSKSLFDDGEFQMINDAEVKVVNLTSGQSFYLNNEGKGDYKRTLNPTEGHNYSLEIVTSDGRKASARTYVPSVLQVHVVKKDLVDHEGKKSIEIDIEIEDNPSEENFYVWEVVEVYGDNNEPATDPGSEIAFLPDQADNNEATQLKSLNSPLFLSDDKFNGKVYSTKLTLGEEVLNGTQPTSPGQVSGEKPRFNLKIMAVSKDLFEYLRTYQIYKQTEIKVTSSSQPVDIYSNIENGLGIFGGYNLKEFPIY